MAPIRSLKSRPARATARKALPHPSRGGTRGYGQDMRLAIVHSHLNGDNLSDHAAVRRLQDQNLIPSDRTKKRWIRRYGELGHARPFVMQGNQRATVLRGLAAVNLALYRCALPHAMASEVNAFLFNASGFPPGERRLYDPSQITRAEDRLGLTKKVGSITAYQAKQPRNIMRRQNYWNDSVIGLCFVRRTILWMVRSNTCSTPFNNTLDITSTQCAMTKLFNKLFMQQFSAFKPLFRTLLTVDTTRIKILSRF
jgi:hypothetical protein